MGGSPKKVLKEISLKPVSPHYNKSQRSWSCAGVNLKVEARFKSGCIIYELDYFAKIAIGSNKSKLNQTHASY